MYKRQIFDLRGKALNRAAQIAKTMGAFLPFSFLQIFLSVLKTVELVLLPVSYTHLDVYKRQLLHGAYA